MAVSPPCQQSTWHGNIPLEQSSQVWEFQEISRLFFGLIYLLMIVNISKVESEHTKFNGGNVIGSKLNHVDLYFLKNCKNCI